MLKLGIVGLPNVGKSTLFQALTKKQIDISNYPFTTIDPNVGIVTVPDERLDVLAKLSQSAKKVPTTIEFIDIAGLVKGAAEGEGLGNKFLANIREVDAIAQVVRAFENPDITHVHNKINPVEDIGVINTELILADLDTVNKRIEKNKKERNPPAGGDESPVLDKLKTALESGTLAIDVSSDEHGTEIVKTLNLLTNKPFIYVFNISEEQLKNTWHPNAELLAEIGNKSYVVLANTLELFLSELEQEDQIPAMKEFHIQESGLDTLIKIGYQTLGLITFLTTGPDESRAWTTVKNTPIPIASRAIHTDFEKLFIRAEVISYNDLVASEGWSQARQIGKLRTVGRDYIVQDGDVVEIKI